jgi:hypothetical protein
MRSGRGCPSAQRSRLRHCPDAVLPAEAFRTSAAGRSRRPVGSHRDGSRPGRESPSPPRGCRRSGPGRRRAAPCRRTLRTGCTRGRRRAARRRASAVRVARAVAATRGGASERGHKETERMELLRGGADQVADAEHGATSSPCSRRCFVDPPRRCTAESCCGRGTSPSTRRGRTAQCGDRPLHLTGLELHLLAYFVSHAEIALSRETLLAEVWGYRSGRARHVTVHIRRLRAKMEADPSLPRYLCTVWGVGYRLEPSPQGLPTPPTASAPRQ